MRLHPPTSIDPRKIDPFEEQPETGVRGLSPSPMDPPGAYEPPSKSDAEYGEMNDFLKRLMDEHASFIEALKDFEKTLASIQKNGIDGKAEKGVRTFFAFFDHELIPHQRKEEKLLFPALERALMLGGEHGVGPSPMTAVDMMEDDHVKDVQRAAVVFNFFALAARLPDPKSALITLDAALEEGKALVESIRLHIFREDHVVFPLAHRHLQAGELDQMHAEISAGAVVHR